MRSPLPHLLGIAPLTADQITTILDTAGKMREIFDRPMKKVPTLRGKLVANLFFEPSTRTRSSFEIAEKRLSADSLNFSSSSSSVVKGETLIDTVRNLEAMHPDVIVMRHSSPGSLQLIQPHTQAHLINAGDGAHEHPTQALLDALTIRRSKGRLQNLNVLIAGDLAHSRVVRSNLHLLRKMGAKTTLCGPPTLIPPGLPSLADKTTTSIERGLVGQDVVMMLRIQKERQGGGLLPNLEEYHERWGLTKERLSLAKEDAIVMHPGPINRGVEITSEVADGSASVIMDQVENGVAVRMAVLYLTLAGGVADEPVA